MTREPSAEFVDSLRAALAFWRPRLKAVSVQDLDAERHNLFRAVRFGLNLHATRAEAAEAAVAAFPFVFARGYWREWLHLLEQAREACADLPPESQVRLLIRLAHLRRLNGRLDGALSAHREAIARARQAGDPLLLAEAHARLGRTLRDTRQYDEAEEHLRVALRLVAGVEGERAERLVALAKHALGLVAHRLGRLEEAEHYLEQAVTLRRDHDRPVPLSDALYDLANVYRAAGAYQEALAHYEKALGLLEGTGFRLGRARIRYDIGVFHFSRKAYHLAEATFRAIDLPFLRETGNLHMQAMLLVSLGNALLYQERYQEAAATLEESVSLWRQLEDEVELANAVGSLGEALAGAGKNKAAGAAFEEALALLAPYPVDAKAGRLRALFGAELEKVAGQAEA